MREIKFRAWDKEKMWSWEQLVQQNYAIRYFFFIPDFLELMQYTGLKDKNGKEIYEGDILKATHCKDNPMWEVLWHENAWQQKLLGEEVPYYVRLSSQRVIEFDEVIGNIYENPELLNKE